jgi:hypothetical protein
MPLTAQSVYFENPVGRLSEHAQGYAIVQYKPGKRVFSEFQALLTHLGHLLHRRNWHKVLTDQRVMTPFTDEEREWINQRWLHTPLGVRQERVAAVLLPHDVFARLSSNLVMHDAKEGALTYHIFEDEATAGMWLRQAL